jgi:hypothetical protein
MIQANPGAFMNLILGGDANAGAGAGGMPGMPGMPGAGAGAGGAGAQGQPPGTIRVS